MHGKEQLALFTSFFLSSTKKRKSYDNVRVDKNDDRTSFLKGIEKKKWEGCKLLPDGLGKREERKREKH